VTAGNLSPWTDFLSAFRTAAKVFSEAPIYALACLLVQVLAEATPYETKSRLLRAIMSLALFVGWVILGYFIQRIRWAELRGERWTPRTEDLARVIPVLGAIVEYEIGVGVGLLFAIVPGIITTVRCALVLPLVSIEKRNPIAAVPESFALTRGKFWMVAKYLALPLVIGVLVSIFSELLMNIVDDGILDEKAFSTFRWPLEHPTVFVIVVLRDLATTIMTMVMAVLQVNLYDQFKSANSAHAAG
jgi:hypothetical protein